MISRTKSYHNFGVYLGRKKISNGHALANLLTEKFVFSRKNHDWQSITAEELKERGILPYKKDKNFSNWREEMIKNGILICMATKEELKGKKANHKCNMFKFGEKIKKYIESFIVDYLPERVEKMSEEIDVVSNRVDTVSQEVGQVKSQVTSIDSRVQVLESQVNTLTTLVLTAIPPDTPRRRKIVTENLNDHKKCMELLKEESGQH